MNLIYKPWQYALLILTIVVSVIYSIPNLYTQSPAIQFKPQAGIEFDAAIIDKIKDKLSAESIAIQSTHVEDNGISEILFLNTDDQIKAYDLIQPLLEKNYLSSLNLVSNVPSWMESIGAYPMKLGLDLQGGVHFLLDVDVRNIKSKASEGAVKEFKKNLRTKKIRYRSVEQDSDGTMIADLMDDNHLNKAIKMLAKDYPDLSVSKVTDKKIFLKQNTKGVNASIDYAVNQTITALNNRINELGVSEPVVQREGLTKISVDLPGIQDIARAKDLLGKTATIRFHMVNDSTKDGEQLQSTDEYGQSINLDKKPVLTGDSITYATASMRDGFPVVQIRLGGGGESTFYKATRENIGSRMAVIYSELKSVTDPETGKKTKVLDEKVISAPVIQQALRNEFQITGMKTHDEAQNLALLLRSGSLFAPVEIIEELTVGPSMGQDNIDKGIKSLLIGGLLILIFMTAYYRLFGFIANIGLFFNLLLTVSILSLIGATLTLPGIAGIVLGIGMAVDANVLINERIREELRNGMSPISSIAAGYDKAFSTIVDANITTLIVALILFGLGSGTVKGFAITLSIGLVSSMFTAIFFTRAIIGLIYSNSKRQKHLSIGV